jgi:pimeloyl-ACP methyl ester carboxylesterase
MGASPGQHGSILDSKLGNDNHLSPSTARFYRGQDPRSSSTQSLVPSDSGSASNEDPRRTLLLIYIHGFYGNDQSFRSFPYHVHSYLKEALAETHTIHSKIYPRYKTYRAIEVARDNFSEWLAPHESPTTDVILVGHSMGGILAADVVLMVCLLSQCWTDRKETDEVGQAESQPI